jgi:hypothetical protein
VEGCSEDPSVIYSSDSLVENGVSLLVEWSSHLHKSIGLDGDGAVVAQGVKVDLGLYPAEATHDHTEGTQCTTM